MAKQKKTNAKKTLKKKSKDAAKPAGKKKAPLKKRTDPKDTGTRTHKVELTVEGEVKDVESTVKAGPEEPTIPIGPDKTAAEQVEQSGPEASETIGQTEPNVAEATAQTEDKGANPPTKDEQETVEPPAEASDSDTEATSEQPQQSESQTTETTGDTEPTTAEATEKTADTNTDQAGEPPAEDDQETAEPPSTEADQAQAGAPSHPEPEQPTPKTPETPGVFDRIKRKIPIDAAFALVNRLQQLLQRVLQQRLRKPSGTQLILAANTIGIVVVVTMLFRAFPSFLKHSEAVEQTPWRYTNKELLAGGDAALSALSKGKSTDEQSRLGLSWKQAEQAYHQGNPAAALEHYRKLLAASLTRPADALIVELLKLRCAQCLRQLGQPAEATKILERLSSGVSPIIRAVANYQLGVIDVENGQFLQARIKAYKAAGNLGALENTLGLEADCDFLIARSLTQKALTTHDLRMDIPWPDDRPDPFAALSEDQLRTLLSSGTGAKTNSTLEPQVRKKWSATAGQVFSATSQGAPLENLLERLCAVGGFDIQWVSVDLHVRRRPVVLSLAEVTSHRLCEVACGAAGLIARFDGNRVLVHNPITDKSLLVQRQVVNREGISTWRRFLLRRRDDKRVPLGHLAVASLYECSGDTAGALREYELVGQRFRDNPVSAVAFLRAAKLRIHLRDYTGARTALLNLLDSNPDPPDADDVYLSLGRANMEAGLLDEGVRVFSKLYHLNLSAWSQQDACLGLGDSLYRKANYREANKWFTHYVELVKAKRQRPSPKVYLLWGKSLAAVDRFDEAALVFRLALAGAYSTAQRTEALWELAKAEQQRNNFAGSIAALQKINSKQLDPQQSLNVLLVTAQTYRRMGLPEKAYDILEGGASRISDPQIQFELAVEMSRCQVDAGNPQAALKLLTEAMPHAEPGPKMLSASYELGQICLKAGQVDQAIIVVEDLLQSPCSDDLKRRGLLILGNAYLAQGNYEQAARAFSGTVLEQLGAQEQ